MTTGAKNWVRANGPAMLGVPKSTTAGVLEAHLGSVATYLSGLGQRISNPGRLINFDLARISADDRLDAFISGDFGVGQIGLPLPRLVKEVSTGDVLVTDGTRRLRFASLPNGTYSNPPGDGDVLTIVSGNFVLTARDGSRRQFSPTGVFQSSATPDGRVTTFTYSGTRLMSIASPSVRSAGHDLRQWRRRLDQHLQQRRLDLQNRRTRQHEPDVDGCRRLGGEVGRCARPDHDAAT